MSQIPTFKVSLFLLFSSGPFRVLNFLLFCWTYGFFFKLCLYILEPCLWRGFEVFEIVSFRENCIFISLKEHFKSLDWIFFFFSFWLIQITEVQVANSCENHLWHKLPYILVPRIKTGNFISVLWVRSLGLFLAHTYTEDAILESPNFSLAASL